MIPEQHRAVVLTLVFLGACGVVTVTGVIARGGSPFLGAAACVFAAACLLVAGRIMLGFDVETLRILSLARISYSYGVSGLAVAAGIAASWAGFHGKRIDGVALLGGTLFVLGGFGLFIGTIQAGRARRR